MSENSILEVSELHKYYDKKHILKGVSLNIPRQKIFALLGQNGAGKTTFLKSILSLTQIKSGKISIDGVAHTEHLSRKNLAYFPERFFFYPYYTVQGAMEFYGNLYQLSKEEIPAKIQEVAKLLGIESILEQKISQISKGQLQRSGLACTFMSKANLFILDEPFSGLDPIAIKEVKDVFQILKAQGKTLFINSHILSEVEIFADEVAIINEGTILTQGSVKEVIGQEKNLEEAFYRLVKGDK